MPNRCSALAIVAMTVISVIAYGQAEPQLSDDPSARTDPEARAAQREVAALNNRLASADQLSVEQSQRLTRLLLDVQQVPWHVQSPSGSDLIDRSPLPGLRPRSEQEQHLVYLEAEQRILEQRAELLLERVPRFLSSRQVQGYARLLADGLNRGRAEIDSLRRSLGIPDATRPPATLPDQTF